MVRTAYAERVTARTCSAIRDDYARSQAPTADDQAISVDLLNIVLQLSLVTFVCAAQQTCSGASAKFMTT
jgi:hypothetical protein